MCEHILLSLQAIQQSSNLATEETLQGFEICEEARYIYPVVCQEPSARFLHFLELG